MGKRFVFGVLLVLATAAAAIVMSGGRFITVFDLISVAVMVFIPLGAVWMSHGPARLGRSIALAFGDDPADPVELERAKACVRALSGYIVATGIFAFFIGFIFILGNLEDKSKLGPNLAVSLICALYAAFLLIVFSLPITARLDDRLIAARGSTDVR